MWILKTFKYCVYGILDVGAQCFLFEIPWNKQLKVLGSLHKIHKSAMV